MPSSRLCLSLALLSVGCASDPARPAAAVRVDVAVNASTVRVGDVVALTLVASNPTDREARWSSGCGLDLGFEVRASDGQVVETPEFGICTAEARQLSLAPHALMVRTVGWRVGSAARPGGPVAAGTVTIHGRLGVVDRTQRSGTSVAVYIAP